MPMRLGKRCGRRGFYWRTKGWGGISMRFRDIWWVNFYLRFANVLLCSIGCYAQYLIVIYLCALNQFSHAFL